MLCTKCGASCAEGTTYCIHCGNKVSAPEAPQPYTLQQPQPQSYSYYNTDPNANAYGGASQPAYGGGNQPSYGNPNANVQNNDAVSVGDWVLTVFVQGIPIVGIIMMFIWGFGGDTKKSKSNYCKAALIWMAIAFVLLIIFFVAMGSIFMEIMRQAGYYY